MKIVKRAGMNGSRKNLKETVMENKIKAMTIFSQGIAHDFANVMSILQGNITLAKLQIRDTEKSVDLLTEAEYVCERARDLIKQLSALSADFSSEKSIMSIGDIIKNAARYCLKGAGIKYSCDIDRNLFKVKANEGQLYQVFTNLMINAAQAMPNGGNVDISARNIFIDLKSELPLKDRGWYLKIDIADNGVGIPEEDRAKIFEPYFSSKGGNGLGLVITSVILKKHGGCISVDSKCGDGSVFQVYLPAVSARNQRIFESKIANGRVAHSKLAI